MLTLSPFAPGVRPDTAPARAVGRSAETKANAPRFAMTPCLLCVAAIVTLTVPPAGLAFRNDSAALLPQSAVMVCSCEFVSAIIAGEMLSVAVDDPDRSAVIV